ncbi:MAG: ABC transporter permease [Bacteroidetes bacterium]|jgi:ABC-type lipoprotein release transport system permease subunit|nr:ABC transporter permease [Bacteroidota bacterium]MBT6685495.1 ABC transporter permease [Bacteroidota bacterium]MBT7144602.1 ABC transporter permease [Bacteroidota bacterium]MBT7493492.1 ABC transporter permease [Bacteroidota bacterium]
MYTNFKIAWRNLWRNRRRTSIAISSILFGVLFSAIMSSMQEGSYTNMVDIAVKFYSGSIQIHKKGYWENQKINNTFESSPEIIAALENEKNISFYTPRLESYALASSEEITKGALVLGIDPEKEDKVTNVKAKMKTGNYLKQDDDGVLIAEGLADYLKLKLNDTLVMIGQGYHGVSAAGKYPIRGIIKHPNPEFNRLLILMEISNCQNFYSAENLLASYVVMLDDYRNMTEIQNNLKAAINDNHEVMTWEEMQPVLVQQIESDRGTAVVFKIILYLVIGFGILGTIMMMMSERKRELGVIVAVGMQKLKLMRILFIETMLIGLVGVIAGIIVSFPITYYLYLNPIPLTGQTAEVMINYGFEPVMKFAIDPKVFYNQALAVFAITIVISIYPIYNISKLRVIEALRG